jgi:hypothetical protein
VAVIAALYAAVFCLRLFAGTPVDAYSMLYVLPVALAATAFGLRAGLAAAVLAVALIATWAVVRGVDLSATAWASRILPLLLLGYLLGSAMDRLRQAEADRRRIETAALLHREAIEINDSLIQRMTAAKWMLEAGQTEASLTILNTAVADAQQLVSALIRRAGMADRTEPTTATESPAATG